MTILPQHERKTAMNDIHHTLGRIEAKLDSLQQDCTETKQTLMHFDERLRSVELRSSRNGAITGAITAIAISVASAKLRLWGS